MRIDGDIAVALSAQASYIQMLGLNGKVRPINVKNNTGTRKLQEDGNRSVDLEEVLKNISLDQNKTLILRLLPLNAVYQVLGLLNKDQMVNGLRYFSNEQLLRFVQMLPPSMVIGMMLTAMPMEQICKMMPTQELFRILRNQSLDERTMVKGFAGMDDKYLRFMMTKMTGKNVSHLEKPEMLSMCGQFKKRQFLDGMQMMSWKGLTPLVTSFAKNDSSVLQSMSGCFVNKIFSDMGKICTMATFSALPEDMLLKCLGQLPVKSLIMAASQVDDSKLGAYLLSQQPQLLMSLAA